MAVRNKTPFMADEVYFITFTIFGWKNIFVKDKYCQLVFKWFDYLQNEYGNKIHGYVIMSNHIHILLFISRKSPKLPILILNAKRFLSYGIRNLLKTDNEADLLNFFAENKTKSKSNYKFFEPRYDSLLIQTEKFFLEKLNYIHNNPCQEKWSLSDKPEDYIYSSALNYITGKGLYEIEVVDF